MDISKETEDLFKIVAGKSSLKNLVYINTLDAFKHVKTQVEKFAIGYNEFYKAEAAIADVRSKKVGDFEIDLKFGGDVLLFLMHTNVFQFPRDHEVMKTPYVNEDSTRSYCGIINIYNFISDSFKYNRVNDVGYLIGRIFINRESHYFIEGKRELGFLYNNFGKNILTDKSAKEIIDAAVKYTVNFDLLTPHYDIAKFVTVNDIKHTLDSISMKTGKRLGDKFQADNITPEK